MKRSRALAAFALTFIVLSSSLTVNVGLAGPEQPHGVISLAFDDGWQSQYNNAVPLLQARGITGTFYIISGKLSDFSNNTSYMSMAELQALQNYGCEIASHSVTHPDFTKITDSQIEWQCDQSKQVLQSYGLTVNNFAYPYGSYNEHIDSIVSQYYRSGRNVYCPGNVSQLPFTQWDVPADEGAPGDPGCLNSLESIVDQVYSTNEWAVIYFHHILQNETNTLNIINTETFASFLDYVQSKGVSTLTVNQALNLVSPPAQPPSVMISPTSVGMDIGQSRTFNSSISYGNPAFSYQWYLNDSAVSGATNASWVFTPETTGIYKVYLNVTDALNFKVQSNIVTDITANPLPTVTINSTSVKMTVGTTKIFSGTVAGGTSPHTYQWYYANGTAISGATTSTLAYKANSTGTYNIYLNATDSLSYRAKSNTATITVYSQPSVTIAPTTVQMTVGTTQTFTSTITGGLIPYTYQWYQNDSAASGATGSTWNFTTAIAGHNKVYLSITDALNFTVQSNIVTDITVNPQATATISPPSANMIVGATQTFIGIVTGGTSPCTYQWYINDTAVSGATNANWTFTPTAAGTYNIYLSVTDDSAVTVESNTATAKTETPTTVNITPTQTKMDIGQAQIFSSTTSGSITPYTYQWYLNDSAVPGANGATWPFSPSSTGHYIVYLNVTDGFNLNTQSNIVTDISVYSQLTVSVSPGSASITVGDTQQFSSSTAGGLVPYIYQWYYANSTAISGATTSMLTFVPNQAGTFSIYLNVTDSLNAKVQSNTATINITPSPTATPTPTPTSTATPTSSPTATPTHVPTSTPTSSVSPTNSPGTASSSIVPYYVAGAVAAIAVVLIAGDVLVIRKRLLSSSPPPPSP